MGQVAPRLHPLQRPLVALDQQAVPGLHHDAVTMREEMAFVAQHRMDRDGAQGLHFGKLHSRQPRSGADQSLRNDPLRRVVAACFGQRCKARENARGGSDEKQNADYRKRESDQTEVEIAHPAPRLVDHPLIDDEIRRRPGERTHPPEQSREGKRHQHPPRGHVDAPGQGDGYREKQCQGADIVHEYRNEGAGPAQDQKQGPLGRHAIGHDAREVVDQAAPGEHRYDQEDFDDGHDRRARKACVNLLHRYEAEREGRSKACESHDLDTPALACERQQHDREERYDGYLVETHHASIAPADGLHSPIDAWRLKDDPRR